MASKPTHHKQESKTDRQLTQRQEWVEKQLEKRINEWTEPKNVTVFVGTYNVNGKAPPNNLNPWLILDTSPDIYVIGFQEIVSLNGKNLVVDHKASEVWEERIERTVPRDYCKVSSRHLVGVSLCIYVRRNKFQFISGVSSDVAGVGIMGVAGNKGAAAIRFNMYDTSLCFVCSHLAAGAKHVAGRNSHYYAICERLQFPVEGKPEPLGIFDHEKVYWLGDLNYRLNFRESDMDQMYSLIEAKDYASLLIADQLLIEKASGNTFVGFYEGKIDFAPTYKYIPQTNVYDRRPDKKLRAPAWCDRILWRGSGITLQWYKPVTKMLISDHKPVSAMFDMDCRRIVQDKRDHVQKSLGLQLDRQENDAFPRVTLNTTNVDFGLVKFDTPCTKILVLENVGQVFVEWRFAERRVGKPVCSPWYKLEIQSGLLLPNESAEIAVSCLITKEHSFAFQIGLESLEEIIILKLENGRDYFITIRGMYAKSCFGTNLHYLVNTPEPVRTSQLSPPSQVLSVPKEIWQMIDFIYKNGMDEDGLFMISGLEHEIDQVRESLDCGKEIADVSVHSVAETLLRFLSSLMEPLLAHQSIEDAPLKTNLGTWADEILATLRPSSYNSFVYLVTFLREVLRHSASNGAREEMLVVLFASCMTQTDPETHDGKPKSWYLLRHYMQTGAFA